MKSVNEYLSNISPSIKEKFKKIKFIVFDFDGVFTDNQVYTDQNGIESVVSSKFDGFGLQKLRDLGINLHILSTEKNSVVKKRDVIFDKKLILNYKIMSYLHKAKAMLNYCNIKVGENFDMETIISVVAASLGNTGPALGTFGPTNTWAEMHFGTLIMTSILMWFE